MSLASPRNGSSPLKALSPSHGRGTTRTPHLHPLDSIQSARRKPQPTLGCLRRVAIADHTTQGRNDSEKVCYDGSYSPLGSTHHYRFTLYALDITLDLEPGATVERMSDAIREQILATER